MAAAANSVKQQAALWISRQTLHAALSAGSIPFLVWMQPTPAQLQSGICMDMSRQWDGAGDLAVSYTEAIHEAVTFARLFDRNCVLATLPGRGTTKLRAARISTRFLMSLISPAATLLPEMWLRSVCSRAATAFICPSHKLLSTLASNKGLVDDSRGKR